MGQQQPQPGGTTGGNLPGGGAFQRSRSLGREAANQIPYNMPPRWVLLLADVLVEWWCVVSTGSNDRYRYVSFGRFQIWNLLLGAGAGFEPCLGFHIKNEPSQVRILARGNRTVVSESEGWHIPLLILDKVIPLLARCAVKIYEILPSLQLKHGEN